MCSILALSGRRQYKLLDIFCEFTALLPLRCFCMVPTSRLAGRIRWKPTAEQLSRWLPQGFRLDVCVLLRSQLFCDETCRRRVTILHKSRDGVTVCLTMHQLCHVFVLRFYCQQRLYHHIRQVSMSKTRNELAGQVLLANASICLP